MFGLAIGISTIMFQSSAITVQASSILNEITAEETTEDHAEDISYNILRGNHLNSGTVKVQRMSSNEIAIYGLTQCHHVCDEVYLYLYLERKVMVAMVHIDLGSSQTTMLQVSAEV